MLGISKDRSSKMSRGYSNSSSTEIGSNLYFLIFKVEGRSGKTVLIGLVAGLGVDQEKVTRRIGKSRIRKIEID